MNIAIDSLIQLLVRQRKYVSLLESWLGNLEYELSQRISAGETTGNRTLDLALAVDSVRYDGHPPDSINDKCGKVLFELENQMIKHPGELALIEVGPWEPAPELFFIQLPGPPASLQFLYKNGYLAFPAVRLVCIYAARGVEHSSYLQDGYFRSWDHYDISGSWFTPTKAESALAKMTVGTYLVIRRLNILGDWLAYYPVLKSWGIDTPVDRLDRIRRHQQPPLFDHKLS